MAEFKKHKNAIVITCSDLVAMDEKYLEAILNGLNTNNDIDLFDFYIDTSYQTVNNKVSKKENYLIYSFFFQIDVAKHRLGCRDNQELAVAVFNDVYRQYKEYLILH